MFGEKKKEKKRICEKAQISDAFTFLMHFAFRTGLSLSQLPIPSLLHFEKRVFWFTLGEPTSLAIILLNFAWRRPGESVTDVYLKECGCWRYLLWVHTQRKMSRISKLPCQMRGFFSNSSGLVLLLGLKTLVCLLILRLIYLLPFWVRWIQVSQGKWKVNKE